MKRFSLVIILALVPLLSAGARADQASASPAPAAAPPTGTVVAAVLPRHLVYQFGYNTKPASSGTGTGKTTIDIGGPANDGGVMVKVTDDWWNTVQPRQSYTCELYADGSVTCAQAPYAISPIQIAVVPMLAAAVFSPLANSPTASWNQNFNVKATFAPGAYNGFAGEVNTWKCNYSLTGAGTVPNSAPLILIHGQGEMKEQGGRYRVAQQKFNVVMDPRLQVPAIVAQEINFVPENSIAKYTIELQLIETSQGS